MEIYTVKITPVESANKIIDKQELLRDMVAEVIATNSLLAKKGYTADDILGTMAAVALDRLGEEDAAEMVVGMYCVAIMILTEKFLGESQVK